jgi:hypothetical protein
LTRRERAAVKAELEATRCQRGAGETGHEVAAQQYDAAQPLRLVNAGPISPPVRLGKLPRLGGHRQQGELIENVGERARRLDRDIL